MLIMKAYNFQTMTPKPIFFHFNPELTQAIFYVEKLFLI